MTHSVGGFTASVDVAAKLADLVREADAEPMGSGREAIQLCVLDCAPLVLARMPPDTPLTNLGGISDPEPQPARGWHLHIWIPMPDGQRRVVSTRVYPNVSHEHLHGALAQHEVLGKLTVRRDPDGRLRYDGGYTRLTSHYLKFSGPIELGKPFAIGNPRDDLKASAVLSHDPVPPIAPQP